MIHASRFKALCEQAVTQVSEVSVVELHLLMTGDSSGVLLDVREDHEWVNGCLPQSVHCGRGILERDIERLYPELNTPIVLYCGGGYRSALAALSLQNMGYTDVRSLQGGFKAWVEAGHDVIVNV